MYKLFFFVSSLNTDVVQEALDCQFISLCWNLLSAPFDRLNHEDLVYLTVCRKSSWIITLIRIEMWFPVFRRGVGCAFAANLIHPWYVVLSWKPAFCICYADDITHIAVLPYFTVKHLVSVSPNICLVKISAWCMLESLILNPNKSQSISDSLELCYPLALVNLQAVPSYILLTRNSWIFL